MEKSPWPLCDVCKQTVPRAIGRLLLKEDDVTEYGNSWISEDKNTAQRERPASITGGPSPESETIPWRWGHEECLPDSRYMVVAKKFDNIRMLLEWTLNPVGNELIARTNWRETSQRFGHRAVA